MDRNQQTELITKLISMASKDNIANLIDNITKSENLEPAQKQELLAAAYERQIIVTDSVSDMDKVIKNINKTDSGMLTDSQKESLLKTAYERQISVATKINQLKDIIDNINASSLTDKNSLLEQAYLKEIELSDTFDNIYGRVIAVYILNDEAPSIRADSYKSSGIFIKIPEQINIV